MKKYIYIVLIAVGAFFQSCDLDTEATSAAPVGIVFNDVRSAQFAMNGTWSYLMDTYYTYQNPGFTSVLLASDAMGSDVAMQSGKYGYYRHYSFVEMANGSSNPVTGIWQIIYRTINNTNLLLAKIDDVPTDPNADQAAEEAIRQSVKGQAYALRGYLYFYLATFYGDAYQYKADAKCVPIYVEPTVLTTEGNPKSTVAEVYSRAEEDLKTAHVLLKDFKRPKKHYIDKQVIAGLLARLYNQRMDGATEDWKNALTYAAEAQSSSSWMTKVVYLAGFNDRSNNEWIWGHGQTTDQSTASYSFQYKDVKSDMSGYYSFMADPYFIDLFKDKNGAVDAGDVRSELFEWDTKRFKGGLMYKKFLLRVDETADIVLMRKAEMVLIEAESLAELSRLPEAIVKLNELRKERGAILLESSVSDKKALIDIIMLERRKELFGEGFSLSDIKRRQNTVVRKEVPSKTPVPGYVLKEGEKPIYIQGHTVRQFPNKTPFNANSPYYNFLIPAIEITNNPNLDK